MDIHYIENKKVRKNNVTLVFFDKKYISNYDGKYVTMIHKSRIIQKERKLVTWLIVDIHGNEYRLRKTGLTILDETTAIINKDNISRLMFKSDFKLFLNNNSLPDDTILDVKFVEKYLDKLSILKKVVNNPIFIWKIRGLLDSVYSAIIIIGTEIVGRVYCEILSKSEAKEYYNNGDIMYPNMNLYISRVDIREDYQGNGLCKPLLTYMIKHLRRLGYEQLFIDNASFTKGGIPACLCYIKSGLLNNYRMRHKKTSKIKTMNESDCHKKDLSKTYYYMSNNIAKRARKKIKKHFMKL